MFDTRRAGLEDCASLEALYAELNVRNGPQADIRSAVAAVLAHPGTDIWLALDQAGQPVAMATLHILPNVTYAARPYALIENVASAGDRRGQGFGKAVMEAAKAAAFAAGAYKIMLLTGRSNAAVGFYERLGFDACEKHGMVCRAPV